MKNIFCAVGLFLILSASVFASEKWYVEGELLIKFKNGTASAAARNLPADFGASIVQEFPELGWQLVKLPAGVTTSQGLEMFNASGEVEIVQPNYIYRAQLTPNDPSFGSLYAMTKINAPAAWDVTTGSGNVVVAVIDTGIRSTHEDLVDNLWRNAGEIAGNGVDDDNNGFIDDLIGWDFARNDSDPEDEFNHGTHVAGTIGARGNNGRGVAGVNWNVKLMALKIHDAAGNSTAAKIMGAFGYVRTMRLRGVAVSITNNSYGGCPEACGFDQATKDAIDAAGDANIVNIFAAGNANTNNDVTPFFPSSYESPSIVAVAASDQNDNKAGFSGTGLTTVDLAAPGVGIFSTNRVSDTSYGNSSGTSMASPHVAGAAALIKAAHPNLSAASLKATLLNTVTPLMQWNGLVKTGGRLNVQQAIATPTVCNFNLSRNSQTVTAAGGVFDFNVSAAANCDFSVVPSEDWITVMAGNPGSGNTVVRFDVRTNLGAQRTGTIRVAGQNFTVQQTGAATTNRAVLDFDGDGKTDFSALQNAGGSMIWHNLRSMSGYNATSFGLFSDTPVPADFDGDGKTDFAVWRGGGQAFFYVLNSATATFQSIAWGTTNDVPQTAQDFDADGKADFVVTRTINNQLVWFVLKSTGGFAAVQFGATGDKAVRGDFDADGKADFAVYRPANSSPANTFFVLKSADGGLLSVPFGNSAIDRVVSGDFDGDRKTDFAVWRTTNGAWYWLNSSNGQFSAVQWGANGDVPAPGDYNGDGRTDRAVWRPANSAVFYVDFGGGNFASVGWGASGMKIPAENFAVGF